MGHAEAYKDEGTPGEQTRRTFMVQATMALGGLIGLGIAIPVGNIAHPESSDALGSNWSPLSADELTQSYKKSTDKPIKVSFAVKDERRLSSRGVERTSSSGPLKPTKPALKAKRPELYSRAQPNFRIPSSIWALSSLVRFVRI